MTANSDKLEFFKTEIRKFIEGGGKLTSGSLIWEGACCALGVILYNKGRLPIKNSDEEYDFLFRVLNVDANFTEGFDKQVEGIDSRNENYQLGLAVRSFCENEGWI